MSRLLELLALEMNDAKFRIAVTVVRIQFNSLSCDCESLVVIYVVIAEFESGGIQSESGQQTVRLREGWV
jgi:hypothetical protein